MYTATGGRTERGDKFLSLAFLSLACFPRLPVLQEPKRWVHGATKIKLAQACEYMSRGFT